jgi:hypothetical protein
MITYELLLRRELTNLMVILISGVKKTIKSNWSNHGYRQKSFEGLLFVRPQRKLGIFSKKNHKGSKGVRKAKLQMLTS